MILSLLIGLLFLVAISFIVLNMKEHIPYHKDRGIPGSYHYRARG